MGVEKNDKQKNNCTLQRVSLWMLTWICTSFNAFFNVLVDIFLIMHFNAFSLFFVNFLFVIVCVSCDHCHDRLMYIDIHGVALEHIIVSSLYVMLIINTVIFWNFLEDRNVKEDRNGTEVFYNKYDKVKKKKYTINQGKASRVFIVADG